MSKPLTIDELKALEVGDWAWITDCKGKRGTYARKCACYGEDRFRYETINTYTAYHYIHYGKLWLAYKNKEQAETKGEWVEFHCKVGDTVYFPWRWEDEDGVASAEVEHIATRPDGKSILYLNLDSDVVEYVMEYREHLISDFGKTWFTDKSEAEARLKELRGEK